jgi:putative oxidoreductase
VHGSVADAPVAGFRQTGGWALELQGMFLFTAIALALIGPGRYRVNDR